MEKTNQAKVKKNQVEKICEWCLNDFSQKEIFWVSTSLNSASLACKNCIKTYKLDKLYPYNHRIKKIIND